MMDVVCVFLKKKEENFEFVSEAHAASLKLPNTRNGNRKVK